MWNLRGHILIYVVIFAVILTVFGDFLKTFYQQDEWHGLGLVQTGNLPIMFGIENPISTLFGKGRVISNGIYYLILYLFPLNNLPFSIVSIVLHLIASCLVYRLILRSLQNKFISFLGTLFFVVNSVSQGGITWSFVAIGTIGSTILILISILYFFKFIESKKNRYLLYSTIVLYISLLFKETGLYLFIFLPISALLFKKFKIIYYLKKFWIMYAPFLLIVLYRVLELKFRTTSSNLYITGQDDNFFLTIIIRAIFYPLTSFSLIFVPGDQFLSAASILIRQLYPYLSIAPNSALITQTVVLDILSIILTFIIFVFILKFLLNEGKIIKSIVIFWIAFIFMSFLPYVLLSKDFSYMESRYYYLSNVGAAFLISWFMMKIIKKFRFRFVQFIFLFLYVSFLMLHIYIVRIKINDQIELTKIRQNFIAQLKINVPNIEQNRNIFYITSDKNYWADTNMIPFQQGTGFTLMVLYRDSRKIPMELFKEGFLFDIGSQGYKEVGQYGFGYFWDKNELEKLIDVRKISPNSIISLHYDSKSRKITKIYFK